jgi:hypothetical protein
MYFVSIYENRTRKPVEVVLRKRRGKVSEEEQWRGESN